VLEVLDYHGTRVDERDEGVATRRGADVAVHLTGLGVIFENLMFKFKLRRRIT
jgi:hypothetical protein